MYDWLIDVTDLKQYTYCPRIVYYRYCLPAIRPITFTMTEGTLAHESEEQREERRKLRHYGIETGERLFETFLHSYTLGIKGKVDLIIVSPSKDDPHPTAIIVDYKNSDKKAGAHIQLQIAAYALLVEELWHIPVTKGFLYSIPNRKAEEIVLSKHLRAKVKQTIADIHQNSTKELIPDPPKSLAKCCDCEFRRFCNDVV